jgi:hypothetical protein
MHAMNTRRNADRRSRRAIRLGLFAMVLGLGACGRVTKPVSDPAQLEFWYAMRSLCGQSFAGHLVTVTGADSALIGQPLVLDFWQCYHRELRLAFHVGPDHSRVWLLESDQDALRLSHSLHDSTGAAARFSGYGGKTSDVGTPNRQVFHIEPGSLTQVPAAAGTSWALEIVPRQRVTYMLLASTGEPRFRVDFDLTQRVPRPPSPWGFTRARGGAPDTAITRSP